MLPFIIKRQKKNAFPRDAKRTVGNIHVVRLIICCLMAVKADRMITTNECPSK